MKHFTYRTTHTNGKYYVGRHSTNNIADGYIGSGKWVCSIKDKATLTTEILEYADNFDDVVLLEDALLSLHYGKPNCMNLTSDPIGFGSENNPMKDPNVALKIAGDNHWTRAHPENVISGDDHWMNRDEEAKQRFLNNHPNKDGNSAKLAMERGTHVNITNNPSTASALNGTHHWQHGKSPNADGKLNKKLVENGTHNFLGPDHNQRMIAEGKNPWVGSNGNLQRLANGTHPSQMKETCIHCNKTMSRGMHARWHGDNCKLKA